MASALDRLAALSSATTKVNRPRRIPAAPPPADPENNYDSPPSYRLQIQSLAVGESFARAHRFDGDRINKDTPVEAARGLRLSTQPTVHRISKATGMEFTIECGDFRTLSRDVIVALVVTRTL